MKSVMYTENARYADLLLLQIRRFKFQNDTNVDSNQPGTTATVLSARSTRIVLNAAKLPSGNAIVMYLR